MNQIFETDRLVFRNWQLEDAEILYKYASDRQVCELALWPRHESVEMSRQVIKDFFLPNRHNFAIVLKETGEPIGCIGLVPQCDEHYEIAKEEREVGYWVGKQYWNNGIATESLKGLIGYCYENLRLKSLLITTANRNVASQCVAEKCGFQFITHYDYNGDHSKLYRLKL